MKKTIRREVQLKPKHQEMIKKLMKQYSLVSESKAIIKAIDIACIEHQNLLKQHSNIISKLSKLQNEYDYLDRIAKHYSNAASELYTHYCKNKPF